MLVRIAKPVEPQEGAGQVDQDAGPPPTRRWSDTLEGVLKVFQGEADLPAAPVDHPQTGAADGLPLPDSELGIEVQRLFEILESLGPLTETETKLTDPIEGYCQPLAVVQPAVKLGGLVAEDQGEVKLSPTLVDEAEGVEGVCLAPLAAAPLPGVERSPERLDRLVVFPRLGQLPAVVVAVIGLHQLPVLGRGRTPGPFFEGVMARWGLGLHRLDLDPVAPGRRNDFDELFRTLAAVRAVDRPYGLAAGVLQTHQHVDTLLHGDHVQELTGLQVEVPEVHRADRHRDRPWLARNLHLHLRFLLATRRLQTSQQAEREAEQSSSHDRGTPLAEMPRRRAPTVPRTPNHVAGRSVHDCHHSR